MTTCTQCGEEQATTTYVFPVCKGCYLWLQDLQVELDLMEKNDPELKRLGDEIDEIVKRMIKE